MVRAGREHHARRDRFRDEHRWSETGRAKSVDRLPRRAQRRGRALHAAPSPLRCTPVVTSRGDDRRKNDITFSRTSRDATSARIADGTPVIRLICAYDAPTATVTRTRARRFGAVARSSAIAGPTPWIASRAARRRQGTRPRRTMRPAHSSRLIEIPRRVLTDRSARTRGARRRRLARAASSASSCSAESRSTRAPSGSNRPAWPSRRARRRRSAR